jgi:hypothetical protein
VAEGRGGARPGDGEVGEAVSGDVAEEGGGGADRVAGDPAVALELGVRRAPPPAEPAPGEPTK